VAGQLAVWLRGFWVATIEQERRRLRLMYTADALTRYPLGTPLLSAALPLTGERYSHAVVSAFLDGLLPEGEARQAAARVVGVLRDDTFGLIGVLGLECAGALVIQPADQPSPPQPTTRTAVPLSDTELADLVANLRSAPLGIGGRVRLSLAGVQEKLLLTRMIDGSWGQPVDGTPSTHILKPEIAAYPNTVENEAFCMRVAKHLGVPVAEVQTTVIAGRRLIVVERYDRVVKPDGSVERLHQEDMCQAVGSRPEQKYEEDGGPSLRRVAGILQAAASGESLEELLRAVTLNVLIGNGDAHAKNFSLLHQPSGVLELAPLYDLMCTLYYGDDRLAMFIDDVRRTDRVTFPRLANEAIRWGLSRPRAEEVIVDVLERAAAAVDLARIETDALPLQITEIVSARLTRLRSGLGGAVAD
jgi:serine/threonine-protein kinase HipA